jgi:hypothetical protein
MFRIPLHPQRLPHYGMHGGERSRLPDGYGWWRLELPTGEYTQQYDNPDNIHEMSLLLFDGDARNQTGEIVDPPALHVTRFLPEYDHIDFASGPPRSMMTRGMYAVVDVVCNDCLGDRWQWLPGNTCRPGDYQIEERERREPRRDGRPIDLSRRWDDSTRHHFDRDYPMLQWPLWAVFNRDGTVNNAQLRASGFIDIGVLDREGFQQERRWSPSPDLIIPRRSPNVLPESQVIDEIDRLVNDQVRVGPRDDYRVNRYPPCKVCGHQWHGLDCERCECINTEWLKREQT